MGWGWMPMPYSSDPEGTLLGPWPPEAWGHDAAVRARFPVWTLRWELLTTLDAIHRAAEPDEFPAVPPGHILGLLSDAGPPLDHSALPVIEGVLHAMWREGLIGAVPPPTPHHPTRYMSRGAAMRAIAWGAPVILWPQRDGAGGAPDPGAGQQRPGGERKAPPWSGLADFLRAVADGQRRGHPADGESTPAALFDGHRRTAEPLARAEVDMIVAAGLAAEEEFDMRGGDCWWHRPTFPDPDAGDREPGGG